MSSTRIITVTNRADHLEYQPVEIEGLFHYLDVRAERKIPPGELSLVFLEGKEMSQLHADFFDDPNATDVITFPGEEVDEWAGEICVSVDFACQFAKENNLSFGEELTLYLVHGWLHLAGLEDLTEAGRNQMRIEEKTLIELIAKSGLFPLFTLKQSNP